MERERDGKQRERGRDGRRGRVNFQYIGPIARGQGCVCVRERERENLLTTDRQTTDLYSLSEGLSGRGSCM